MKVLNAFSVSMLDVDYAVASFRRISAMDAQTWLFDSPAESAIGHADTARIVGGLLRCDLPANRVSVKLACGERAIIAQYVGPRLPEGATELPAGAKIEFVIVEIQDPNRESKLAAKYGESCRKANWLDMATSAELTQLAAERAAEEEARRNQEFGGNEMTAAEAFGAAD